MEAIPPVQTQNPDSAYSAPTGITHHPYFWILLAILLILPIIPILRFLAKKGLFVMMWPTTTIDVQSRAIDGSEIMDWTGTLCLSVPFVVWVWYGQSIGLRRYSLLHSTVTRHSNSFIIPLTDLFPSIPEPLVVPSLPIQHKPALLRDTVAYRGHQRSRNILGLELRGPHAAFGSSSLQGKVDAVDHADQAIHSLPNTPETSHCYLTLGASRSSD